MRNKYFDTSVGVFIVIGVLCLIFLAFRVSGTSFESFSSNNYTITADFKDVGSLRVNASVKISGVEVGRVTKIDLEKTYNGFMAAVTMSIDSKQKIPATYSASIAMSGILGDNYVALNPNKQNIMAIAGISSDDNGAPKYLEQGSVIDLENTESAINLGSLINTFVANKDNDESK